MTFYLTEEQKEFRESVKEFVAREVMPRAERIERDNVFPWDICEKMSKLGYFGLISPPEHGGSGKGVVYVTIVSEELGYASAATWLTYGASMIIVRPIHLFGNEEQKRRYLTPLSTGEKLGAITVTEPDVGSDVASIETTATLDGDEYILNGRKKFITNSGEAKIYLVYARTDPKVRPKHRGISAFIVDADMPGFRVEKVHDMMGMRGARNGELSFKDVRVPMENLLGGEGEGFYIMMSMFDPERVYCAACSVGIAQAALDASKKFAKERVEFDQPISNFQAISFRIADMATWIEAARLLTYKASHMVDKGMEASREAAMAKAYAGDVAMKVTVDAVQIHGGYGYLKDYPIERYMRDTKVLQIAGGTTEMQKLVVSRAELK